MNGSKIFKRQSILLSYVSGLRSKLLIRMKLYRLFLHLRGRPFTHMVPNKVYFCFGTDDKLKTIQFSKHPHIYMIYIIYLIFGSCLQVDPIPPSFNWFSPSSSPPPLSQIVIFSSIMLLLPLCILGVFFDYTLRSVDHSNTGFNSVFQCEFLCVFC